MVGKAAYVVGTYFSYFMQSFLSAHRKSINEITFSKLSKKSGHR